MRNIDSSNTASVQHFISARFASNHTICINTFNYFFKVFIEFVTILFLFYVSYFFIWLQGMWNPRMELTLPTLEGQVPTTGLPGKSLHLILRITLEVAVVLNYIKSLCTNTFVRRRAIDFIKISNGSMTPYRLIST